MAIKNLTSVLVLLHLSFYCLAQDIGVKWIVRPISSDVDSIYLSPKGHESLVTVWKGGKQGVVDTGGAMIVPPEYNFLTIYPGGWIQGNKNNKTVWINETGKVLTDSFEKALSPNGGYILVSRDGKWGAIDNQGYFAVPVEYDRYVSQDDRHVFFKDTEEKELIMKAKPVFKNTQKEIDEKAKAVLPDHYMVSQNKKSGFLNAKGDTVIPMIYQLGAIHPKGFLVASLEPNLWGVIDKNHKTLYYFTAERMGAWTESGLLPVKEDKQWGLLRFPDGKTVIPFGKYDYIEVFDKKKDWFIVKKGELSGVVDVTGKERLPIKYTYVSNNDKTTVSIAGGKKYGYWYVPNGRLQEPVYRSVQNLDDTLCIIVTDSMSAVVNVVTGKTVIPFRYGKFEKRGAFFIVGGILSGVSNKKYYLLYDLKGNQVFESDSVLINLLCDNSFLVTPQTIPPKDTEHRDASGKILRTFKARSAFERDKCWIRINPDHRKSRYILCTDLPGKEVYYDDVSKPEENLIVVRIDKLYGYVSQQGKLVVPVVLEAASPSKEGYLRVKYRGHWGILQNPAWP